MVNKTGETELFGSHRKESLKKFALWGTLATILLAGLALIASPDNLYIAIPLCLLAPIIFTSFAMHRVTKLKPVTVNHTLGTVKIGDSEPRPLSDISWGLIDIEMNFASPKNSAFIVEVGFSNKEKTRAVFQALLGKLSTEDVATLKYLFENSSIPAMPDEIFEMMQLADNFTQYQEEFIKRNHPTFEDDLIRNITNHGGNKQSLISELEELQKNPTFPFMQDPTKN